VSNLKGIQALYRQIPGFTCNPGCTDCCGPVPWAKSEWDNIGDKRKATSIDCPYSLNGVCDCYDARPFICRIFGASSDTMLACPHGCKPDLPLTKAASDELSAKYFKLMGR
jgi:hypothetical protein